MTVRTHLSRRGLDYLSRSHPLGADYKPVGFWYEVDGDWQRWCRSEMPHWLNGVLYEVDLKDTNMLFIRNAVDIDLFHYEYAEEWILPDGYRMQIQRINWRRVAEKYSGIEIAPYLWERRLNWDGSHPTRVSDWYYGWDCASGVVWDTSRLCVKPLGTVTLVDVHEDPIFGQKERTTA